MKCLWENCSNESRYHEHLCEEHLAKYQATSEATLYSPRVLRSQTREHLLKNLRSHALRIAEHERNMNLIKTLDKCDEETLWAQTEALFQLPCLIEALTDEQGEKFYQASIGVIEEYNELQLHKNGGSVFDEGTHYAGLNGRTACGLIIGGRSEKLIDVDCPECKASPLFKADEKECAAG